VRRVEDWIIAWIAVTFTFLRTVTVAHILPDDGFSRHLLSKLHGVISYETAVFSAL